MGVCVYVHIYIYVSVHLCVCIDNIYFGAYKFALKPQSHYSTI